jgi:hypothetical protein
MAIKINFKGMNHSGMMIPVRYYVAPGQSLKKDTLCSLKQIKVDEEFLDNIPNPDETVLEIGNLYTALCQYDPGLKAHRVISNDADEYEIGLTYPDYSLFTFDFSSKQIYSMEIGDCITFLLDGSLRDRKHKETYEYSYFKVIINDYTIPERVILELHN